MASVKIDDLIRLRGKGMLPSKQRHLSGALGRVAHVNRRATYATVVTPEGPLELELRFGTFDIVRRGLP